MKAEVFTDGGTEITERGFVYALSSAVEGELTLENAYLVLNNMEEANSTLS